MTGSGPGVPLGWSLARRRVRLGLQVARQVGPGLRRGWGISQIDGPGANLVSFPPRLHQSAQSMSSAIADAAGAAKLPTLRFSSPHDGSAALAADPRESFRATVAHAQPGNLPLLAMRSPWLFRRDTFVACVAYWETPDIKRLHSAGGPWLDEIWTLSGYSRTALQRITSKPVRILPYPVVAPAAVSGRWREYMGLRDEFVLSFQFDMASTVQRKNPGAVVAAFVRAFPVPQEGVRLVIKTMNGDWFPRDLAELRRMCASRDDIVLAEGFWPSDVNDAYYADIDCFVSLHRAEGLGIGMARAMAAGTPVVATGFSGNLEFMDDDSALLVPYRLVPVGPNPVYSSRSMWAEPDVDAAADAIRSVFADSAVRRELAVKGAAAVTGRTVRALGEWIRHHLPNEAGTTVRA